MDRQINSRRTDVSSHMDRQVHGGTISVDRLTNENQLQTLMHLFNPSWFNAGLDAQQSVSLLDCHQYAKRSAGCPDCHRDAKRSASFPDCRRDAKQSASFPDCRRDAKQSASLPDCHRDAKRSAGFPDCHRDAEQSAGFPIAVGMPNEAPVSPIAVGMPNEAPAELIDDQVLSEFIVSSCNDFSAPTLRSSSIISGHRTSRRYASKCQTEIRASSLRDYHGCLPVTSADVPPSNDRLIFVDVIHDGMFAQVIKIQVGNLRRRQLLASNMNEP